VISSACSDTRWPRENPHASEDYARACVPMGNARSAGGQGREGQEEVGGGGRQELVQTFHFAAGRRRRRHRERGLIFLFNSYRRLPPLLSSLLRVTRSRSS